MVRKSTGIAYVFLSRFCVSVSNNLFPGFLINVLDTILDLSDKLLKDTMDRRMESNFLG